MNAFYSQTAKCRVRWHDLPGSGDPLIFIHGLGCASSFEYPRIVTDPSFAGRRAILLDLPGCGYSEKPQAYGYTITEQADVVVELVRHIGAGRCYLYGHSMGGSVAIDVATRIGDVLAGLVVSEPNFHPGGGFFSKQICRHSEAAFVDTIYPRLVAQEQSAWAGSLAVDAPWAIWRGAASLIEGNEWFSLFTGLAIPTQLIFGEHSLPDEDFSCLEAMGVPVVILPDCGHSMSWENPSALAQTLATFCDELAQSPASKGINRPAFAN